MRTHKEDTRISASLKESTTPLEMREILSQIQTTHVYAVEPYSKITKRLKTVATSGGFDPIHIGHINLLRAAKKLGDYHIVILNGDSWLERKKGKPFIPADQRAEIIRELRCVDYVYVHNSDKNDVCGALEILRPDVFANGGDRRGAEDIPEVAKCNELGIEMVFGVGGDKVESSSWLLKKYEQRRTN